MSIQPYVPASFATPIANPAVGGAGTPFPYVSVSEYKFAPTAMDVSSLVPNGGEADQDQSLADILRRASGWADRICFGADPAAKGASLCATLSIESGSVSVVRGELRLVCDYKPIIQVNGIDVGADMASLASIGANLASRVRVGIRTIYVPLTAVPIRSGDTAPLAIPPNFYPAGSGGTSRVMAVWSYVNGYPHTMLAEDIAANGTTCVVQPTDGATGLLGIIPGVTQFTIKDGAQTERFTVSGVSGTTLTSAAPFQYSHTVPAAPDSIPVTALPADVAQAVIFLATTLIKTQGDNAIVLEGFSEPKEMARQTGGVSSDFDRACGLLRPFSVRVKGKS